MIIFWYFKMTLLNDTDIFAENIERLVESGGLHILKQIFILKQSHLLFDIVNSEQNSGQKLRMQKMKTSKPKNRNIKF